MTRGEFLTEINTGIMFLGISGCLALDQFEDGRPAWGFAWVAVSVLQLALTCFRYFDPKCRSEDPRL